MDNKKGHPETMAIQKTVYKSNDSINSVNNQDNIGLKYIPELLFKELEKLKKEQSAIEKELKEGMTKLSIANLSFEELIEGTPTRELQEENDLFLSLQEKAKRYFEIEQDTKKITCSVFLEPAKLPQNIDQAEEILCESNCNIYQRGGQIVTITKAPVSQIGKRSLIQRKQENLVVKPVDEKFLTEKLTSLTKFYRYNPEKKGIGSQVNCPQNIAGHLISRQQWNLPLLSGIIQSPTLRADGSVLEKEGYDKETGLFFSANGCSFEKIPSNPTKKDAEEALKTIRDLIEDFPFEDGVAESVAISAILTALVRQSISTAPLHAFSAPKMSSGKSLLSDVVSLIMTGKDNGIITQAENETEEAKRILAVLQEGASIVCIDNVERPLGSPTLCSVLTQSVFKGRILGETKTATYPTSTFFLANGNNIVFIGDLSTRAILCKLDPKMERPEEREFKKDLRQYIPKNRGILACAALTILKAYHDAGRPKQDIKQYGRFEEWSDWVRSAIVWLGLADPCESRKDIENEDPVRASLGNLLETLHERFGKIPFTIKKLIDEAQDPSDEKNQELREVLVEFCPSDKGSSINVRSLGRKLLSFKGRIERGLHLEQLGKTGGSCQWRIAGELASDYKKQEQSELFNKTPGETPNYVANSYVCKNKNYSQYTKDPEAIEIDEVCEKKGV